MNEESKKEEVERFNKVLLESVEYPHQTTQLRELTSNLNDWKISDKYIREDTLNEVLGWWVEDVGLLTPKMANHIKRAMARAIFDQDIIKAILKSHNFPTSEVKPQ